MGDREGQGRQFWPNGDYYTGLFIANEQHGEGSYVWSDESVFTGSFVHGEIDEHVEQHEPNGQIYIGQFHSIGERTITNGDIY